MPFNHVWPDVVQRLTAHKYILPPSMTKHTGLLADARVDHVAVACTTYSELQKLRESLIEWGGSEVEPLCLWPNDTNVADNVHWMDRKYLTTVCFGEEAIVGVAPHTQGDLISQFLGRMGNSAVHHVAYSVQDIEEAYQSYTGIPGIRSLTPIVRSNIADQAFLSKIGDHQIIELIQRKNGLPGTLATENIAALTEGERINIYSSSARKGARLD